MSTPDEGSNAILGSTVNSPRNWYLKLTSGLYTMSQLGKKLQELIQGTCSLSEEPVWLLGLLYGLHNHDSMISTMPPEMQQLLLEDFSSKFWFTYRRDFTPIGSSGLSSDVGWGCTIRSGQMMMAEALARCWWGRTTSLTGGSSSSSSSSSSDKHAVMPAAAVATATGHRDTGVQHQSTAAVDQSAAAAAGSTAGGTCGRDQLQLLQLFQDQPGPATPFSLHSICRAGAHHGVVPGQWLGPWVLCKALAAAAAEYQQQQTPQQQQLGLQVHVICDPGGGAPTLQLDRLMQLFTGGCAAAASGKACSDKEPSSNGDSLHQSAGSQQQQQQPGLLLLVPLTLGVGKINQRYLPQLSAVLTFPQSVGIVGGRPSASLYFLGVQGTAVLYLDPHEVQEVAALPEDVGTFHCSCPRLMPLASIDPSLAIGFYCSTTGDLQDLAGRLKQLADSAAGAPLMTVDLVGQQRDTPAGAGAPDGSSAGAVEPGAHGADDWELV